MRGQVFSMDALVSMVIVVMIIGTVSATSESIKNEIVSLIDWYERANVAENMLDVLLKSPGEPEDWHLDISKLEVVGLRSSNRSYALDYLKVMKLSSPEVIGKAIDISNGKDFMLEVFLSRYNVSINGTFPRVYLANVTFGLDNPSGGANFRVESPDGRDFTVSYILLRRSDGTEYENEEVCKLVKGNVLKLGNKNNKKEDESYINYMKIITTESTSIDDKKDDRPPIIVPPGTVIEIFILNKTSDLQINFNPCWQTLKITGQGNVVVTVSAYDSTVPNILGNYTFAQVVELQDIPTLSFSVINGTVINDKIIIEASMERSPWVEVEKRTVSIETFLYDLSANPSSEVPMIYGVLRSQLPAGSYLKITVPDLPGNMSFVVLSKSDMSGLMIYRMPFENIVRAVVVHGNTSIHYTGNSTSISIPLKDLFGNPQEGDTVAMWLYSLEGWDRGSVKIEIIPDIKWALAPKLDAAIIKLWVWDDS
ncbi:hypothetical protein PFC_05745 [Pyrococcus furiosus COM1]|uniref:Uncharacterized protein n=1 Tax=Pyrococcus furiosus COM1 TaxID=1185654 RepID=I6UZJ2_9EURY|nr:hypothetical protein PFC_05745 [Pyrococcus furiosus COM1]